MRIVVCLLAACTAASDSGPIVDAEDSVVEAPADASACGAFEPWDVEGRTWRFEHLAGYIASTGIRGGWKDTAPGLGAWNDEPAYPVVSTGWSHSDTVDTSWTATSWFQCDDEGVWLRATTRSSVVISDDVETASTVVADYHRRQLVRPRTLEVGATWSRDAAYTLVGGDETGVEVEVAGVGTVEGHEQVETPAGTFDARRLQVVSADRTKVYWVAEGVGVVMTQDFAWLTATTR